LEGLLLKNTLTHKEPEEGERERLREKEDDPECIGVVAESCVSCGWWYLWIYVAVQYSSNTTMNLDDRHREFEKHGMYILHITLMSSPPTKSNKLQLS